MSRIALAPIDPSSDAAKQLEAMAKRSGFVPNSLRIMAWKPAMLGPFSDFAWAILGPGGQVPTSLKQMIAYVTSLSAGCRYCQAHTGHATSHLNLPADKLAALWSYESSPMFSEAERAALRVAQLAGQVPNGVEDEDFAALKAHYSEEAIVEIVSVIAFFGFMNRWNDTFATPLEDGPLAFGRGTLAQYGWSAGSHA